MLHPLQEMMQKRRNGEKVGIPSYCSSNRYVIEAALERAVKLNAPALIEATANQVNQFGGYSGMKPKDFMEFVLKIAKRVNCPEELIILAGDHLGPLIWADETEEEAMKKADTLVYEYVLAGFTKIHLDTSMKLADDSKTEILATETIAKRGVRLYKICMEAYDELLKIKPEALRPVFIIGSEVPIPGGAQELIEGLSVTRPEDFEETVNTYKRIFRENGFESAWNDIIGVVVQPGVEFGDSQVFMYDHEKAKKLCEKLRDYPEIIFEGHSTDYQSKECLREMNEDGIAILKVGPALTFGYRDALFALSAIEKELIPAAHRAYVPETLEEVMILEPKNWNKHYHGNEKELSFARKFSFSDRARYYFGDERVEAAVEKLFLNLSESKIPMNILYQYMPIQYGHIINNQLNLDPKNLCKDVIIDFMKDYEYAAHLNEK